MKYFLRMNFRNLPFFILLIVALTCTFTQADEVPTKEIKIKELTLQLPETWIKKESSNQFRLAEFDIPAPESELENAELVLFHFQGGAGKTDANITRWLNQFESDGRVANFKEGKTEQGSYIWVDISGTYKKPVGAPFLGRVEKMEDARVVSVILNTKTDVYYLKLIGKEEVIKKVVADFRKSFGGKSDTEQDYKFEL